MKPSLLSVPALLLGLALTTAEVHAGGNYDLNIRAADPQLAAGTNGSVDVHLCSNIPGGVDLLAAHRNPLGIWVFPGFSHG